VYFQQKEAIHGTPVRRLLGLLSRKLPGTDLWLFKVDYGNQSRASAYEAMAAFNEKNTGYSIFLALWLTDQLGKRRGSHHVD